MRLSLTHERVELLKKVFSVADRESYVGADDYLTARGILSEIGVSFEDINSILSAAKYLYDRRDKTQDDLPKQSKRT
jgi:hypothetical protein